MLNLIKFIDLFSIDTNILSCILPKCDLIKPFMEKLFQLFKDLSNQCKQMGWNTFLAVFSSV